MQLEIDDLTHQLKAATKACAKAEQHAEAEAAEATEMVQRISQVLPLENKSNIFISDHF